MYKSIQISDFLKVDEIKEIKETFYKFESLLVNDYLVDDYSQSNIEIDHWNNPNDLVFIVDKIKQVGLNSFDFSLWVNDIKHEIDVVEFWKWVEYLICNKLYDIDRKFDAIKTRIFNFKSDFETHCEGPDILNKKSQRPKDWSDLKKEEWYDDNSVYNKSGKLIKHGHQGLINIDCDNPNDGTIIFDQSFPYSVYCDYSKDLNSSWKCGPKVRIIFCKGDSIERFGEKIEGFTFENISEKEYDAIVDDISDKSSVPLEAFWGLTTDKILYLDKPGTLISWQIGKFHRVKPFDSSRKRLCVQYETTHYV